MTEEEFQADVLHIAKLTGWRTYHPYDSRRSTAGWPDLALVRGARFMLRELKTEKGRVSPAQQEWLDDLQAAGVDADVWRPRDLKARIPAELARAGAR